MISASTVLRLDGLITDPEGVWLAGGRGANGKLQSAGAPNEPMSNAAPTEPRNRIPNVLPNHAVARTRNNLRPESSTKTGDFDGSPVVVDAESSTCSSPVFTTRLYADSQ